jgi:ribonuclease P protein component
MNLSYPKNEKLKSRKLIEKLFSEGTSITSFPLKLIFLQTGNHNKTGVSVSKKNFRKAVERNKIKRLLREAFRHNKYLLIDNNVEGYAFMILYISKDLPDYKSVNNNMKQLFTKFLNRLGQDLK